MSPVVVCWDSGRVGTSGLAPGACHVRVLVKACVIWTWLLCEAKIAASSPRKIAALNGSSLRRLPPLSLTSYQAYLFRQEGNKFLLRIV